MNEPWRSHITIEPGKRGGRPCIRGMRITVYDVLSYLAAGMSVAEVLDDFPYLTRKTFRHASHLRRSVNAACSWRLHEAVVRPKSLTQVGQSPGRLVSRLEPCSVGRLGPRERRPIWEHARLNGFAIVTKDVDYNNLSVLRGTPPKVLWLQLGNCTTSQVEAVFRARFDEVTAFDCDASLGTFVVK
jgi:uncharacterized protein (DUF433 family)/predicted nuclease of predicted toxin-antitoxin system